MSEEQKQSAWDWDVFWPKMTETPQKQIKLWLIWWSFSVLVFILSGFDGIGAISRVVFGGSILIAWFPPLILFVRLNRIEAEGKK